MSSLNTVLVSASCPVAEAVRLQFQSRGRPFIELTPQTLATVGDSQLSESVIVDLSWNSESVRSLGDLEAYASRWRKFVERCNGLESKYCLLGDGRVLGGVSLDCLPVTEDRTPPPVDDMAALLVNIERHLLAQPGMQTLVLRSGPILVAAPGNLLELCLQALRQEKPRVLENRRRACPTPVADLARVVSAVTDQLSCGAGCRGLFHYNSGGACGYYEFVEVVHAYAAQFLAASSVIAEEDQGESWQPWVPEMSCERLLGQFGIKQLPWRAWLPKLIKTLCEEEN